MSDISEHERAQLERQISIEFLRLINASTGSRDLIRMATGFFQQQSGCDAVGIRLRSGDDFPYFEYRGFSQEFILAENSLCIHNEDGELQYDDNGHPVLDCMCGNVICGQVDFSQPFFTPAGSFWTNCTTTLLASMGEAGRQTHIRNRCNREGYKSVALIPLCSGSERFGLLQLNSHQEGMFTVESIAFWESLAGYLAVGIAKNLAQEQRQESEDRYRCLFNEMTEGFALHEIICDEHGEPCNYRFLDLNPAFERLTGLQRAEVIGKTMQDVLPGEDPRWIKLYGAVALTGQSARFERQSSALNKHYDVHAYRPAAGQFAVMFTDVTDRKLNEETLEKAREWLALSANSAQIGMFEWNPTTGDFICTQQTEIIFGYPPGATPTTVHPRQHWVDRIHPDDLPRVRERIRICMAEGTLYQADYRIIWSDGSLHWIAGQGRVFYGLQGEVTRMLGTVTDITERKRADEEKLEMERRLLHSQKLESLGILAGGIAHDFNNILSGIMGYADLAMARLPASEPVRADIEVIQKATRRAADLTRQMLAYSGKGRFVLEAVNLSQIVEDSKKILAMSLSKKATVRYRLASSLPAVQADSSQICQVVMNLVINASEALGEYAGVISVSTDAISCESSDLATMAPGQNLPAGLYVCLEVADTGCGMDEQTLARIFEPFFTTKFTGRGLGLAAVHGIVRGHKGAIRVSSEPGKGTKFQVLFPASDAEPSSRLTKPAAAYGHNKGTILVVDDEEMVRMVAGRMMEHYGFSTLTASGGLEAIRLFRERQHEVSCVVLDLTMPDIDGAETFRELRSIRPDVPVILCSGYSKEAATERFADQDLTGFIQKPYRIDALIARIQEALAAQSRDDQA